MKFKKILFLTLILYILVLLQSSFLVHFSLFGIVPNLVMILVVLLNLLEKDREFFSLGLLAAFIGGFFLDIFSIRIIGFYILILVILALFIKIIIRKHVRIPISERI